MGSYWLEEPRAPLTSPHHDGRVDVAIVGGGVTGLSCALSLARGGARVRVHEARGVAGGASGRNGGFALRGGAMAYDRAIAQLGRERARAYWAFTEEALDRMAALAGDALRRVGSLRLAADDGERDVLATEYEALRADGFAAEWLDDAPAGYYGGVRNPADGALHPARWIRGLAERAACAGVDIREHDRVDRLEDLDADHVVVATDGYTSGLVPELDAAVTSIRNQVVVTEPLSESLYPLPHYARYGFDYWQQLPDGSLLAGGCRDADMTSEETDVEALTPVIQGRLESLVAELTAAPARITHRWAGIFGVTADLLPLVGELPHRPGVWAACGYSGHGNVLGFACGELVADALLGRRDPLLDLFDPARAL